MKYFLAFLLLSLGLVAQPVPGTRTTQYTRSFLLAVDAEAARNLLGLTSLTNLTAQYDSDQFQVVSNVIHLKSGVQVTNLTLLDLTADRVLVLDANGIVTNSAITASQLAALSGIDTSLTIQQQLATKLAATNGAAYNMTLPGLTSLRALQLGASNEITNSTVTTAELATLAGIDTGAGSIESRLLSSVSIGGLNTDSLANLALSNYATNATALITVTNGAAGDYALGTYVLTRPIDTSTNLQDAGDLILSLVDPTVVWELIDSVDQAPTISIAASSDTDIVGLSRSQLLQRNGTNWVNGVGTPDDDSDDDAIAINAMIADYAADGGGTIRFGTGQYDLDTSIELKSRVYLEGAGVGTVFALKAAADVPVFTTPNWDTQWTNNVWLESAGMNVHFGLRNLRVEGNASNQTSTNAHGIRLYGKAIQLKDLVVANTLGWGIWTRGATGVGGATNWNDMPESNFGHIQVWRADQGGWLYQGPHDGRVDRYYCGESGYWTTNSAAVDFRNQFAASLHSGTLDIGMMHTYASRGNGIEFLESARAQHILVETSWRHGLYLEGQDTQIDQVYAFQNNWTGAAGEYQNVYVHPSGTDNTIMNLRVKDSKSGGGVKVDASSFHLGRASIEGQTSSAIGLDINANGFQGDNIKIFGFDDTGGIALRTGETNSLADIKLSAVLSDSTTLWSNGNPSLRSHYRLSGTWTDADLQTPYIGVRPNAPSVDTTLRTSFWDVMFRESANSTNYFGSYNKMIVTDEFFLDTFNNQTWTKEHNLLTTPRPEDIRLSVRKKNAGTNDWALAYLGVNSISTNEFTVHARLHEWTTVDNRYVETVEVEDGGTGYAVSDVLTLSGGTFTTAATVTVATIGVGDKVNSVTITNPGQYDTGGQPTDPVSTTGGTGTGCTLNIVWGPTAQIVAEMSIAQ